MNSLQIALLLAPQGFSFAGGSPGELVERLHSFGGRPVVAMLSAPSYSGTTTETSDPIEAKPVIARKLKLAVPKFTWGFGDSAYPEPFALTQHRHMYGNWIAQGATGVELKASEGVVTAKVLSRPVPLSAIESLEFKKQITIHWFYRPAPIYALAEKADERLFLETAAEAVGAKAVHRETGTKIEFDPSEYRQRMRATLADLIEKLPDDSAIGLSARFTHEALALVSNRALAEAFETEGADANATYSHSIPPRLRNLVIRSVTRRFAGSDGTAVVWGEISNGLDLRTARFKVTQKGLFEVRVLGKGSDGKPFQVVF